MIDVEKRDCYSVPKRRGHFTTQEGGEIEGYVRKDQDWSGGRGGEGNVGKSLYCNFCKKEQVRPHYRARD